MIFEKDIELRNTKEIKEEIKEERKESITSL